ncbi:MAG: riboflavin synthase [Alteromonadaceae bacterium]|jgi:riboflavin synthase|uniref:Riboflavin synthase n=1 Tax=Rheinheimera aquimaris TaxID=412437 RepID=A0ABP3P031_9GAMM|nr:riboflavin synthase [Rheinheimera aquimaris]MBJ91189.1 riboflavin synthase [Alteromonadaceae bacterium]MCB5213790.1 riboflavin synthase [Rheinheimera aquimaris]|tara:strand:+ start:3165 stop:3815 length:651 start_codon:yes stop_codon:yes gene_type:complete
MFTGIIEATGKLAAVVKRGNDISVTIDSAELDFSDVKLGDSIACNGVCLTVTHLGPRSFNADISSETLAHTLFGHYQTGQRINLEKAMLPTTRMGGHIVSGHVDGVSQVIKIEQSGRASNIWLSLPANLARYVAAKGSVTVDGISLTVNELNHDAFRLTIVPHTAAHTTIAALKAGSKVHLEVDLIARYLERLLSKDSAGATGGVSMALLSQRGFL